MNTIRDLYDLILNDYGKRGCWISELSAKLGICKRNVCYLTNKMGYHRGRAIAITSYADFAKDPGVQAIFKTI